MLPKISFRTRIGIVKFSILLVACFLFLVTPAFAQGYDIGYSKLDPSSSFYFLKGVREEIEIRLALTTHVRLLRQLEFATRRIREARSLVSKNQQLIPASLERYTATLGTLLDRRVINDELALKIESSLSTHLDVLQQMYQDLLDADAKRSVRATINRIVSRPDVPKLAKLSACSFLKKEASSSALTQSEQIILLERARKCLGEQ